MVSLWHGCEPASKNVGKPGDDGDPSIQVHSLVESNSESMIGKGAEDVDAGVG